MITFKQILSEIKLSGGKDNYDYEEASKLIKKMITRRATDISDEMPGYKYGAYSGEAWDIVRDAMEDIGIEFEPEDEPYGGFDKLSDDEYKKNAKDNYNKIDEFVNTLDMLKLIYLEW